MFDNLITSGVSSLKIKWAEVHPVSAAAVPF